ncbi:MAG: hypothetical protein K0R48_1271 [Gammaproteobacteria bacterium]|jgi:uncharacterized protein YaiI (UPF0178 family)|nr:hypothetical protein [Gammaproteobacteria bacterium]
MKIYVDADACPKAVKEILYKAAIRCDCELILVANQPLTVRRHPLIRTVQVGSGFDVADSYIVAIVEAGDLVITADIPLASLVVAKHVAALNPRGEMYTKANISNRLASRDLMDELRSSGVLTGGPAKINPAHLREFANALDRYLAKNR